MKYFLSIGSDSYNSNSSQSSFLILSLQYRFISQNSQLNFLFSSSFIQKYFSARESASILLAICEYFLIFQFLYASFEKFSSIDFSSFG
jgi:hypothetical protein